MQELTRNAANDTAPVDPVDVVAVAVGVAVAVAVGTGVAVAQGVAVGGAGGFGGGGGGGAGQCVGYSGCGGMQGNGAPGGFGGGGGAGGSWAGGGAGLGGAGGFGGGGGVNGLGLSGVPAGVGGFGGGSAYADGGGGAGAGFGGAIFLRSGLLTLTRVRFENNSVAAGASEWGGQGIAAGAALFAIAPGTRNPDGNVRGMPTAAPAVRGCANTFTDNESPVTGGGNWNNADVYGADRTGLKLACDDRIFGTIFEAPVVDGSGGAGGG